MRCVCGHLDFNHYWAQWKCCVIGCECAEFVDQKSFEDAVFEGLEQELKGRKKELERFIKHSFDKPVDSDSQSTPDGV